MKKKNGVHVFQVFCLLSSSLPIQRTQLAFGTGFGTFLLQLLGQVFLLDERERKYNIAQYLDCGSSLSSSLSEC